MKERVLIIEDDEAIVKVLRRGLTYEGYQVDSALDGESGLLQARDYNPDLVVLDLMLPGIDGMEVCRRIRLAGSLPILMLTARETVRDRVEGLDSGADDYMVKPFELNELLARLRVLSVPLLSSNAFVGTLQLSESMAPVDDIQQVLWMVLLVLSHLGYLIAGAAAGAAAAGPPARYLVSSWPAICWVTLMVSW